LRVRGWRNPRCRSCLRPGQAHPYSTPRAGAGAGAPVRSEQRTEGAELEPARVQLARVFLRRHEAADVGSPIRDPTQPGVDGDRNMRAQRLPGGIDVARPEEGAVTLHARVPVAVERERPLI